MCDMGSKSPQVVEQATLLGVISLAEGARLCPHQGQADRTVTEKRPEQNVPPGLSPWLALFTPVQIEQGSPGAIPQGDMVYLKQTVQWMREFIMTNNPNIGRSGAVCPYVHPSIVQGMCFLSVCHLQEPLVIEEITQKVLLYRDSFLMLPTPAKAETHLKTMMIILPEIPADRAEAVMEPLHAWLKTELLKYKLMIGQFYPTCRVPASRNPHFFPLQSPYPMFVIRQLIESDWRFLSGNPQWERVYQDHFAGSSVIRI